MAEENTKEKNKQTRVEIDNNTVKGLFAANSGGAVALLGLLPVVLGDKQYGSFANYVVFGLLCMQLGIAFAVAHNHMRRVCNLHFNQKNDWLVRMGKKNWFFKWVFPDGCFPCVVSHWGRRLSLALFVMAGVVVAIGAWITNAACQI